MPSSYRRFVTGAVPGLVVVLALLGFVNYDELWFDVLAPALLVLIVGYGMFFFKHVKVQSSHRQLVTYGAMGRRRSYGAERLERCVLIEKFEQSSGRYGTTTVARLIVLNPAGRSVLLWLSSLWTLEQMRALIASLQLPVDAVTERTTAKQLRARYPHAVSLLAARPMLIAAVISAVLFAVLAIVIVVATT